jgi:hypothetical protein
MDYFFDKELYAFDTIGNQELRIKFNKDIIIIKIVPSSSGHYVKLKSYEPFKYGNHKNSVIALYNGSMTFIFVSKKVFSLTAKLADCF